VVRAAVITVREFEARTASCVVAGMPTGVAGLPVRLRMNMTRVAEKKIAPDSTMVKIAGAYDRPRTWSDLIILSCRQRRNAMAPTVMVVRMRLIDQPARPHCFTVLEKTEPPGRVRMATAVYEQAGGDRVSGTDAVAGYPLLTHVHAFEESLQDYRHIGLITQDSVY